LGGARKKQVALLLTSDSKDVGYHNLEWRGKAWGIHLRTIFKGSGMQGFLRVENELTGKSGI
jgi:hypothetical protein